MKLFVEAIRKIFKLDFVKCWQKESISEIIALFESQNESKIYCGLTIFYQLTKLYEFESAKNRIEYDAAFNSIITYLSQFLKNVFNKLDNEVGLVILKKILKIIYRTICSDIPLSLVNKDTFQFYLQTIMQIITNLQGADKLNDQSSEEMLNSNFWKVGLLCFQIPFRLISKYANPNVTDSKKLKELSVHLSKDYQPEILKVFFVVLEKSLQEKFPDKIICIIYKYLTHLVNKNSFVDLIVPHLNILLSEFIVQNTIISKSDLILRIDDEKSYIYKVFDVAQSFNDKRYACSSFIRALCEYRIYNAKTKKLEKPEFLEKIFVFLVNMLDKYNTERLEGKSPDPLIKEALMHLFETIAIPVMEHKSEKEIESVIKSYIVPELEDNNNTKFRGVIKEKAIFVIKFYSKLVYSDLSTLRTIVELLCQSLQDKELSVRVVTSVTLPSLMKHPEVKSFLEQYIKNLLEEYLKLMNQIDMEELLVGLENIIDNFGDKVTEYAVDLSRELVNQFNRLININKEDDNGESHLAAEGVIKAINRIVSICCSNKDLISQVEVLIKPVVDYTLSGIGFEYMDEGLDIIKTLVNKTNFVSKTTWSYFMFINFSLIGDEDENIKILQEFPDTGLEGIGYDEMDEQLGVLASYVTKDIRCLVTENDQKGRPFIDRLFQTVEQIIKNSTGVLDVSSNVTCCRMYCQVLDACTVYNFNCSTLDAINIDSYVIRILEFVVTTVLKTKTLTYKLGLYDTLCSCMLYNSKLTLDFIFSKGKLEQVMLKWFDFVDSLKTEKNVNKNIYGLTSCLMQAPNFKSNYNLDPTAFIAILSKNIFTLIVKLDIKNEKKLINKGGIIDLDDSDDEVDMDKEFEEKLKKVIFILLILLIFPIFSFNYTPYIIFGLLLCY